MARLNEPPMSMDSLETLRRKMLRQNRDLAKSNNIRALRIRELENECAGMLSENLQLRGRILELENQVGDDEAQRIADHALDIKAKLESQLTEWGTLLAGLGLEPPMKRHSPRIQRVTKPRLTFSSSRPSPSQRRLRDVARDIEELGHISETKRMSMNHDQILALRSEVDSVDSPELGPPPTSDFIDEEPVKVDSPVRAPLSSAEDLSPKRNVVPPEALVSPKSRKYSEACPSPEKKREPAPQHEQPKIKKTAPHEQTPIQPNKAGLKRKFATRDDAENTPMQRTKSENQQPRLFAEKASIRDRVGGKTLKEMASMRRDARERPELVKNARKPLGIKNKNDDIASPQKKNLKAVVRDDIVAAKADIHKSKPMPDRTKSKTKAPQPIMIKAIPAPDVPPPVTTSVNPSELGMPLNEPALLSPHSPEPASTEDGPRGDTPPPADISSNGETSRPSRRSRAAVSYTEPNLRDKMRRPSKQLFDAVTGEGKYARRMSLCEPLPADKVKPKRESTVDDAWKELPAADGPPGEEIDSIPASPLARKGGPSQDLPSSVATDRRRRQSSVHTKSVEYQHATVKEAEEPSKDESIASENLDVGDIDMYEFTSSSPHLDKAEATEGRRKSTARQGKSRRSTAAVEPGEGLPSNERSSRRRSMML